MDTEKPIADITEWIESEMADIYISFKDDKHFAEIVEYAGSQEEQMRIFDAGFIAGLEYVKRNIPKFFNSKP
jgi:hypothetical protein